MIWILLEDKLETVIGVCDSARPTLLKTVIGLIGVCDLTRPTLLETVIGLIGVCDSARPTLLDDARAHSANTEQEKNSETSDTGYCCVSATRCVSDTSWISKMVL